MAMQAVELLFCNRPQIDYAEVRRRSAEILESELDSSEPLAADKSFLIFHKQHSRELEDGKLCATTAILAADKAPAIEKYEQEIQQSWGCREALSLLRGCHASVLVCEMMAQLFPPQVRVELFHVLRALIDVCEPVALVFKHSQQIVSPAAYRAAYEKQPIERPGSLNVRYFTVANGDGEQLMDTRGLDEIGSHDLQCHFRNLEPGPVSNVLYRTALYVFERGSVIESGQTVEGIVPGSKWRCQFEESILEPKRNLLDLNPGSPNAAGNRQSEQ